LYLKRSSKEAIIETTFLLSLKKGFDNVSVNDIGKCNSMCGSSGIYYHFKKKEDLLDHVIDKYVVENTNAFKNALDSHNGTLIEKLKFVFYYHVGINILSGDNVPLADLINYKDYYLFFMNSFHLRPVFRDKLYESRKGKLNCFVKNLSDGSVENGLYIYAVLRGFIIDWILSPDFDLDVNIDRYCRMILSVLEK
jgi:AcrR family transcriptional regulator